MCLCCLSAWSFAIESLMHSAACSLINPRMLVMDSRSLGQGFMCKWHSAERLHPSRQICMQSIKQAMASNNWRCVMQATKDYLILTPNAAGFVLGLGQLMLCLVFPRAADSRWGAVKAKAPLRCPLQSHPCTLRAVHSMLGRMHCMYRAGICGAEEQLLASLKFCASMCQRRFLSTTCMVRPGCVVQSQHVITRHSLPRLTGICVALSDCLVCRKSGWCKGWMCCAGRSEKAEART